MSNEDLQKQHEAALSSFLAGRQGQGSDSDWALVRALVHRAVHLAADRKAGEFCALATLLAEMIGHAHGVLHGNDQASPAHRDNVH